MFEPIGLDIRTVVVLFHGSELLLLKRGNWKKFAPDRWTGLGGKVEPGEETDLVAAARRELREETDLQQSEVIDLHVRRLLLFNSPVEGPVCLVYLTGSTTSRRLPACNEGSLRWVPPSELASLDIIENTANVLPFLIRDVQVGDQSVHCGVAAYEPNGALRDVTFAPDGPDVFS